jgi:ribosomal protein L31E
MGQLTDSVQLRRVQQGRAWTRAQRVPRRVPQLRRLLQRQLDRAPFTEALQAETQPCQWEHQ